MNELAQAIGYVVIAAFFGLVTYGLFTLAEIGWKRLTKEEL